MATMEDLALYEVQLTVSRETLQLRRMSERERTEFMKMDFPFLYDWSNRLIKEMDKAAYQKYCKVLVESFRHLCADRDKQTGESATEKLMLEFADNAMVYRLDAFNLPTKIMQEEGLDGSKGELPQPDDVDNMSDEKVLATGEELPQSSQATNTTHSGSQAETPSDGSQNSTDTEPQT